MTSRKQFLSNNFVLICAFVTWSISCYFVFFCAYSWHEVMKKPASLYNERLSAQKWWSTHGVFVEQRDVLDKGDGGIHQPKARGASIALRKQCVGASSSSKMRYLCGPNCPPKNVKCDIWKTLFIWPIFVVVKTFLKNMSLKWPFLEKINVFLKI